MKKLFITMMVAMIAIAANAQYSTNYYNQYGSSIGSSTTHSNYGGGTTTTISFASIRYVRGATTLLHRICHQILTAYEAENGNVVVFVKNS